MEIAEGQFYAAWSFTLIRWIINAEINKKHNEIVACSFGIM